MVGKRLSVRFRSVGLQTPINAWLDESITHPDIFDDLLKPRIPVDLIAQQIDKPSTHTPVAEAFSILADN